LRIDAVDAERGRRCRHRSMSDPTGSAPRIAVVHYSATGNVYRLAKALADGASDAGAEVRVRRVAELAPAEAIDQNPRWRAHADAVADELELATLDDLEWATGIALGSPTRFGLPTSQLKQFLDQTGALWMRGVMATKVVTAFTSASTGHGGLESTILAMLNVAYHWGSLIMPTGYADPAGKALGNPYGASFVSRKGSAPGEAELDAAAAQGRRLAEVVARLS
jgi:NAD(P)H dehydrogenase (quinone)